MLGRRQGLFCRLTPPPLTHGPLTQHVGSWHEYVFVIQGRCGIPFPACHRHPEGVLPRGHSTPPEGEHELNRALEQLGRGNRHHGFGGQDWPGTVLN